MTFSRSSPSKLDFTNVPTKPPEMTFANISGDKLTVAQELLVPVPRSSCHNSVTLNPGLVTTASFRRKVFF